MPDRKGNLEPVRLLIDEKIKNDDITILGTILLQFGNLFTDKELAKTISNSGKFCHEDVLITIKKAKRLALDSMFTT